MCASTVSSWQRLGSTITPAGWWYILISLPILYFFLACWAWLFLLWAWFLFRTSRLDLELTPTHPDRAGGLGFLGWSMVSFGLVGRGDFGRAFRQPGPRDPARGVDTCQM